MPHASEALTGRYTEAALLLTKATTAPTGGAEWLREALRKVEQVKFLAGEETGRTPWPQAAIKFALYPPTITSVLPNFTNLEELRHYTDAVDTPDLTDGEQALLDDLWANDFYLRGGVAQPDRGLAGIPAMA